MTLKEIKEKYTVVESPIEDGDLIWSSDWPKHPTHAYRDNTNGKLMYHTPGFKGVNEVNKRCYKIIPKT